MYPCFTSFCVLFYTDSILYIALGGNCTVYFRLYKLVRFRANKRKNDVG